MMLPAYFSASPMRLGPRLVSCIRQGRFLPERRSTCIRECCAQGLPFLDLEQERPGDCLSVYLGIQEPALVLNGQVANLLLIPSRQLL